MSASAPVRATAPSGLPGAPGAPRFTRRATATAAAFAALLPAVLLSLAVGARSIPPKNMDAVKDGKVFAVDDQLWIQGIGYTAADKILGELHTSLAK